MKHKKTTETYANIKKTLIHRKQIKRKHKPTSKQIKQKQKTTWNI